MLQEAGQQFNMKATESLAADSEARFRTFVAGRFRRLNSGGSDQSVVSSASAIIQREWYTRAFYLEHYMEERYFYCFAAHMIFSILVGAVAFVLCDSSMPFLDAVFSAACCVSQSGLSSLNWSEQNTAVHVVSILLMFVGSMPLLTLWPVLLRRASFRRQDRIDVEQNVRPGGHHFRGMERRRLEYKALGKVIKLVMMYVVGMHLFGFGVLYAHALSDETTYTYLNRISINKAWHCFYLTVSAFQNNGLTLTPNSVEPFAFAPACLCSVSWLILVGNTCFPICLRLLATMIRKCCREDSQDYQAYSFVLQHPRRCLTHLFPPVQTLWLFIVVVVLLVVQIVCIFWQNHDLPVFADMSLTDMFFNALFQSVTTRTAGLNSVDINRLSASTTFLFLVCMYISTSPTVVIMRYSAERSEASELDISGRPEGHDHVDYGPGGSGETVQSQARRYLTQHTTYLVLATFFILCFERDNLHKQITSSCVAREAAAATLEYGDFSVFKVMFEVASAYGTVGLSLGFRSSPASFSGAWSRVSQLILVSVMIVGRLRGLPDSIDPSVAFSMKITGKNTDFWKKTEDDSDSEGLK